MILSQDAKIRSTCTPKAQIYFQECTLSASAFLKGAFYWECGLVLPFVRWVQPAFVCENLVLEEW